MNRVLRIAAMLAAVIGVPIARADNVQIFPSGPVYTLSGLVWATVGTSNGFNNTFFFVPSIAAGNACLTVNVVNNNPTNGHTFRIFLYQTGQIGIAPPGIGSGPNQVWTQVATSGNTSGSAAVGAFNTGVYNISGQIVGGAAQVAVALDGGALQAGSPDTANVIIIQSPGSCNQTQQNAYGVQPDYPGIVSGIANFELTSAVNSPVSAVSAGTTTAPARGILFSVNARCSAGTASLVVKDGATQIWSTAATEVGTTTFRFQWNPGLISSIGNQLTITLSTCGAANTGTLDVQTSVVRVSQ